MQTEQADTHCVTSEEALASISYAIARRGSLRDISTSEASLVSSANGAGNQLDLVENVIESVQGGRDPLGDSLMRLRTKSQRRELGAVYTPVSLIDPLIAWLGAQDAPVRVVDPGCGSARLLIAAGRSFSESSLVGVEIDPLPALVARANLTAAGLDGRAEMFVQDYRSVRLPPTAGATAFVSNPPYTRHHLISPEWKTWLRRNADSLGLQAHARVGMHVYFLLATALNTAKGDIGCFIMPSDWRNTGYADFVQRLLLDALGAVSVHSIDPKNEVFGGTHTTSMLLCFKKGTRPQKLLVGEAHSVADLRALDWGTEVHRDESPLLEGRPPQSKRHRPIDSVELGEICQVRRGALTGANAVWVTDAHDERVPLAYLLPCVTRAKELFDAKGARLSEAGDLRRIVALPRDLDGVRTDERERIEDFLRGVAATGTPDGFVASHRGEWWSVDIPEAAPILATYMARRPPTFVRNLIGARHINIALGLYPRHPLTPEALDLLVAALRGTVHLGQGRAYAGGLTKFEPSDLSRVLVPADVAERLLVQQRLPLAFA